MVYVRNLRSPDYKPRHSKSAPSGDNSVREAVTARARGGLKISWRKRTPLKERITFWRNSCEVCMTGNGKLFEKGDSYGIIKLSGHFRKREKI